MTDGRDPAPADDDALLADLFDALLQDVLDGKSIDPAQLLPDRADLRDRVRETVELANSVAGRREPGRPVLGGYEIVRELGRGGMGTVYLARHQALEREVAIKVLPQSLALSARAKRRFLEEARSLARLRHEHIVHIHRIVDHSEMLAFEMEYVEGPSLQSLLVELRQHGPQPLPAQLARLLGPQASTLGVRSTVEYFVKLGIAIARALGEVHRRGLVHRDVKPSNILLRKNGTPVLADFGLAQDGDPNTTQTVSFAGTPIYAAPERLRHGDLDLDGRADVYSLGVTLYEAITLSPPYQGRSTEELLRKIESGALVPLRQRAPHVSRDLQTVLQKAMESDPRHRYATADAFADDLERLLALQPVHARPKGPLRRLHLAMNRQRRALIAAGVSAAIVAAAFWPMIAHAHERATAADRAAQQVHAAHEQLLQPQCLDLAGWAGRDRTTTAGVDVNEQVVALGAAEAAYDAALQLAPEAPGVASERAVVATVRWLRTQPTGRPDFAAAARSSPGFQAAVAALAPATRKAAEMLVEGSIDLAMLRPALAAATPDDQFTAGLLAALLGDLATCEAAWAPLDGSGFDHPLLDAGLGRLYAADGFPERAYPRLFHASRSFPSATALALELADVALASGDLKLAEQWLAHPSLGEPAPGASPTDDLRRQRLTADLLAARGDRTAAESAYRLILAAAPHDLTVRQRLATLAAERGDTARARAYLQRIVAERPGDAQAHLDLARLALHMGDRAAYLAEARYALANAHGRDLSRGTVGQLVEILRLGGLRELQSELTQATNPPVRDWRRIEPATSLWSSPAQVAGIEQALRVLVSFDQAKAQARVVQANPIAATMTALGSVAVQYPELLRPLPPLLRPAVAAGWPMVTAAIADPLLFAALPFQRNLGTPLQLTPVKTAVRGPEAPAGIDFARTVATVGFVDGTEELLVAAVARRDTDGQGWVEVRSATEEVVHDRLLPPRPGLMFGYSLADIGDLDGDGMRDFAVGAPQTRSDPEVAAAVFVYSGRDHTLLREYRGSDSVSFGLAIAGLGDLDGDGVPDLAVGASPFRRSTMALGSASVLSGKTGAPIRVHHSDRAGTSFGAALANAGDVDGDGSDDLVVGGNLGGAAPLVRIYSGRTGAMLLSLDQRNGMYDYGRSVLGLGDIDGDGGSDIAIAAPSVGGHDHEPGRVLLVNGRTGATIAELVGDAADNRFGTSMCRLPDWRGDHSPALAVGATQGGVSGNGYARVFDLASRKPLQTFFMDPTRLVVGTPVVALGEHASRGRPRLLIGSTTRERRALLSVVWFNLDNNPNPWGQPDSANKR